MLKSLYPDIDWENIKVVGFDLDGTLYDEAEFIAQVYKPIANHLATYCNTSPDKIYMAIFRRWLEKGSSYNRIFKEQLERHGIAGTIMQQAITECITIFREFYPSLTLPARVKILLDLFHERHSLFLITDGSKTLQTAKIEALNLSHWFTPDNVGITGPHGSNFTKPSIHIISTIAALRNISAKTIVFFGDRLVDEEFAGAAGFQYVQVNCLITQKD